MWLKRNLSSHENNVNSSVSPVYRELIPVKFTIVKKIPVWKIRPSGRNTEILFFTNNNSQYQDYRNTV